MTNEQDKQHLQELRSYRITVENREARIVELEAQLAAAQQAVQTATPVVLGWVHRRNGKIGGYFYTQESHCNSAVRDDGGEKIPVVAAPAHPAEEVSAQAAEVKIGQLLALARVMVRAALDADNKTEMPEIKAAIDSEVEFERALRNTLAATHPTQQGLDAQQLHSAIMNLSTGKHGSAMGMQYREGHRDARHAAAALVLAAQAKQGGA